MCVREDSAEIQMAPIHVSVHVVPGSILLTNDVKVGVTYLFVNLIYRTSQSSLCRHCIPVIKL